MYHKIILLSEQSPMTPDAEQRLKGGSEGSPLRVGDHHTTFWVAVV